MWFYVYSEGGMKVARIAVCDDNPDDLFLMKSLLVQELGAMDDCMGDSDDTVVIDTFRSGEELISQIENGTSYAAFFIDIMMDKLTGIETAQRLQQINGQDFDLVFTTLSTEFALDAFSVSAIDYLLKPIDENKLRRALSRCRSLTTAPECITITKNKRSFRIVKREISHIESFAHVCVFHVNGAEQSTYMSMDSVIQLVNDSSFLRCHRSFIVNLAHIQSINGDYLTLDDNTTIPIGRAMRKQMHNLYDEFLIHKIWEKRRSD